MGSGQTGKIFFPWPTLDKISSSVTFKPSSLAAESPWVKGQTNSSFPCSQITCHKPGLQMFFEIDLLSLFFVWFLNKRGICLDTSMLHVFQNKNYSFACFEQFLPGFLWSYWNSPCICALAVGNVIFISMNISILSISTALKPKFTITSKFLRSSVILLMQDQNLTWERTCFKT